MENETIALIGGLLISALTIIGSIINNIFAKRSEYKREIFSKIIESAYKEYEYRTNLVIELSEKSKKRAEIHPFSESVIFYAHLFDLMNKKRITQKDIDRFFEKERKRRSLFRLYNKEFNTMYPKGYWDQNEPAQPQN